MLLAAALAAKVYEFTAVLRLPVSRAANDLQTRLVFAKYPMFARETDAQGENDPDPGIAASINQKIVNRITASDQNERFPVSGKGNTGSVIGKFAE